MNNDDVLAFDTFLTSRQLAERFGFEEQTLRVWRCTGRGDLPFIRLGKKAIRYRLSDIQEYLQRNTRTSTASLNAQRN